MSQPLLQRLIITPLLWAVRLLEFAIWEFTLFAAVGIMLSPFPWSPLGYEPSGLQMLFWVLYFYPLLGFDFLLRSVIRYYVKLPKKYLLAPLLPGVMLIPAMLYSHHPTVAVGGAIVGMVCMIGTPIMDVIYHMRRK